MSFLDYSGTYININDGKYLFYFKNKICKIIPHYFIVSPIYDIGFKKIFFYNDESIDIVQDFMNSILYPVSKSIKRLDYLPKEILSNSHLKHNKGTRIVDNAYLAEIEYGMEEQKYLKKVILVIEKQKTNLGEGFNERCFDYGTGMRNSHDFKETWVVALCLDNSYKPGYDKGASSYVIKELNLDKTQLRKNYVNIHEIYLNKLYNDLEPKSPINGEKIDFAGIEWIKLFCLPLWTKSLQNDDINYIIPYEITFQGSQIKNAITILGTFEDYERAMIKRQLMEEEKKEKEKYDEGFNKGKKQGFAEGAEKGFAEGERKGFVKGNENCILNILRQFYNIYKQTQSAANIEILGKIPYSF